MKPFSILLTGASGFVGNALINTLSDYQVTAITRSSKIMGCYRSLNLDIDENADFSAALINIDVVIHSAARVHIMADKATDPLAEFRKVNTAGTLALARQAAAKGVKRFIFISTVKVNGEQTRIDKPFYSDDVPAPEDPYGISKNEAEIGLRRIASETGMEVVIIRPPLVYGPGVKGNFSTMMRFAQKNLPLPLGSIHNKRSLVALDNLVDLIVTCIEHPKAVNQTFLVSDDCDVSTTELIEMLTLAAGKKPRLVPFPVGVMRFISQLLGKGAVFERLCGNLQVDIGHTKKTLGWKPVVSVEQGIKQCFSEVNN